MVLVKLQTGAKTTVPKAISYVISTLVVAMVVMAGSWRAAQLFGNNGNLHAAGQGQVAQVVVTAGDTLWKLASEHRPVGQDIRKVVNDIRQLNNLESVSIRPGMVLRVPVG